MKKKILAVLLIILCLSATVVFAGCESVIQIIFGSVQNNTTPPSEIEQPENKPEEHTHQMEYVSSEQPTCTGEGSVEYWYCSGCGKYFADENGENEISDIAVVPTGHLPVIQIEDDCHYQKCQYCGETVVAKEAHASAVWIRTQNGHSKKCDVCGATFNEGSHQTVNDECAVCHYIANYAAKCNSSYGYEFLGTQPNGSKYQTFYNALDGVLSPFHDNANANAASKYSDGATRYVCSGVNYFSAGLTLNEAFSVWATYRNDHPLYYWILGNALYTNTELITCVDYNYANGAKRVAKNAQLYDEIAGYLDAVRDETSAYQIALGLHDEIINNINYARDEDGKVIDETWAHGILGVFDRKLAVCDGYSRAFQLLLSARNVKCALVTGVGTQNGASEGHAWNVVEIDGSWYWFDLTWDDQPHLAGGIVYDYFCKSANAFAGHKTNQTNNFNDGINYLYGLPSVSEDNYDTEKAELDDVFTVGKCTYQVSGYNKVRLVKSTETGSVQIAESVKYDNRNYTVAEIGTNAYKNTAITSATIPASVTIIYNLAFAYCTTLTEVIFQDTQGWTRTSHGQTAEVDATLLADANQAAKLIKETFSFGGTPYQYVWEKSAK